MGLIGTDHLAIIARRFEIGGRITAIEQLPGGHINEAYRIVVDGDASRSFLLQRLNPEVFPDAGRVMENIARVTRHLAGAGSDGRPHLPKVLELVPTTQGGAWITDAGGACWRMYGFISGTHVVEPAVSARVVRSAAGAFGLFIAGLADYAGPPIHVTIPGFHDTPARLARLESAARADIAGRAAAVRPHVETMLAQRPVAGAFARLLADGRVPQRIVHNDAKLSNVLLEDSTGEACCVVDLDTVMPGSLLHDFGDMVRSMSTTAAEDEADLLKVAVRYELFEALAHGFLETCGHLLTDGERAGLVLAGRVITLEQAARFLTDYLEGDRYYRDTRGDQNLRRARAQLRLYESLTHAEPDLDRIISAAPGR